MLLDLIEAKALPRSLDSRSLRRRALQIAVVLVTVGVVAALAPGLRFRTSLAARWRSSSSRVR